jgi:hypothetical protein
MPSTPTERRQSATHEERKQTIMSSSRRGGTEASSDGAGLDAALTLRCDERDNRYLMGGNFFGSEQVAPPELEPMAVDRMLMDQLAAASAAAAAAKSGGGGSSSSGQLPPLILKLPGKGSKTPP